MVFDKFLNIFSNLLLVRDKKTQYFKLFSFPTNINRNLVDIFKIRLRSAEILLAGATAT